MSETTIKRGKRPGYTVLQNSAIRDDRLTLKTKGLFAIMSSLPDDWSYTISGLSALTGAGRDTVRTCLRELKEAGYLLAEQSHDDLGKFSSSVYVLLECAPFAETPKTVAPLCAPLSENPLTDQPLAENPTTVTYNKEQIKDITKPPIIPHGENGVHDVHPCKKTGREQIAKPPKNVPNVPKWKPERFAGFWDFYPRIGRKNKKRAIAAWDSLRPDDALISQIGHALISQKASEYWQRGVGIPYVATYLNQRRWEDEADPAPEAPMLPDADAGGWAEDAEVYHA